MSKVSKVKSVNIFAKYQEKIFATAFVFYSDAKHSNILRGPVMFVVFVLVAFVEGST